MRVSEKKTSDIDEIFRKRQFQKSSKMSENSCCDQKMERFGGYSLSSHAQTAISISSAISFQPNFGGLLKLPLSFLEFFAVVHSFHHGTGKLTPDYKSVPDGKLAVFAESSV